jgi:glycosyltransferase involved in cell wall biosynthesis
MQENCFFVGAKYNVCDYIAASYINLLTSKWEGLPTVIIEAMSMGKPCVMTNTDDGEVSSNGKYCMLTELDNIQQITDDLYLLYTDRAVYEKYAKLSLERAEEFKPSKVSKKLEELFLS